VKGMISCKWAKE